MLQSFHHTRSTKQCSQNSIQFINLSLESTTSEFYQTNRWLDPEDSHCNPDQYFKEISYFIDLTGKNTTIKFWTFYSNFTFYYLLNLINFRNLWLHWHLLLQWRYEVLPCTCKAFPRENYQEFRRLHILALGLEQRYTKKSLRKAYEK